jgi:pimeloyl-ACP methyl ester carboxylesterase
MKKLTSIVILTTIGVVAATLSSCTTIADCGDVLGNKELPRIRSSAMRMFLADPAEASARFAPYAAMAALVYEDATTCKHQLPPVQYKSDFVNLLETNGWLPEIKIPNLPACDDDVGTFFRVWSKEHTDHTEVVLVFRGTKGGAQDWITGNLRWFTRVLPGDDQYDRSRKLAGDAIRHIKERVGSQKKVHFFTAGHSLGGGLAQNVLYANPKGVRQAYAFNSSPVTGYADYDDGIKRDGCDCMQELGQEARIYRIYETDEVLAWLRFPLKLAVPLNRHIQEVRFNVGNGHSMSDLAKGLAKAAAGKPMAQRNDWWRGKPTAEGAACTPVYASELKERCAKAADAQVCPR